MSVFILDKDTNKQITVSAGEANNRTPPVFSGTGHTHDPLKCFGRVRENCQVEQQAYG